MSDNEGIKHIHFNKQVLSQLTDFFEDNPSSRYSLHTLNNFFKDFNMYHYLIQLEKDKVLMRSKIDINNKPVTTWQLKKSSVPSSEYDIKSPPSLKCQSEESNIKCRPPMRLLRGSKINKDSINIKENSKVIPNAEDNVHKVNNNIKETVIENQKLPKILKDTKNRDISKENEFIKSIPKNPIMILYEFATQKKMDCKIEVVKMVGPSHKPIISMAANLDGRKFDTVIASNKKEAKNLAAEVAIRTLYNEGHFSQRISNLLTRSSLRKTLVNSDEVTLTVNCASIFDNMASLVYIEINNLLKEIPLEKGVTLASCKVISAIIMQNCDNNIFRIVSLSTGHRCISSDKISLQGKVVNDCHAEVIARRSFMLFIYQQLLAQLSSSIDSLNIFDDKQESCTISVSHRFKLKSNIKFHFYISTAPCGDSAIFCNRDNIIKKTKSEILLSNLHTPTFEHPVQGLLRSKIEGGEGTIPVMNLKETSQRQTLDKILSGERLKTMSCSDKIAKWNYLGVQGSLLTQFIEPIFLSSIFLGNFYDGGHLSRALCCRLEGHKPEQMYESSLINHPDLGYVFLGGIPRENDNNRELSINWSYGLKLEIVDGDTGQLAGPEKHQICSRIAKASLFHQYLKLFRAAGYNPFMNRYTYLEAKALSTDYESKKDKLYEIFQKLEYGSWIRKPMEQNDFKDIFYN